MTLFGWMTFALLLAQPPEAPPNHLEEPPAAEKRPAATIDAPAEPAGHEHREAQEPLPPRFRPRLVPTVRPQSAELAARLLKEALALPPACGVAGQPLGLAAALARANDLGARGDIIHKYWKLAAAMAELTCCWHEKEFLDKLSGSGAATEGQDDTSAATSDGSAATGDSAAGGEFSSSPAAAPAQPTEAAIADEPDRAAHFLAAAEAAQAARLAEAQITLATAQQELAALLRREPVEQLPLAADAPHVGAYRTEFERIYAGRIAPAQAWLLHRTLPIRQQEVEARARAVQAADDALTAIEEAPRGGAADLEGLLDALALVAAQRRALIAVARQYNDDIADYALLVAPTAIGVEPLTSMLIKQRSRAEIPGHATGPAVANANATPASDAAATEHAGGEVQAGFDEPIAPAARKPRGGAPRRVGPEHDQPPAAGPIDESDSPPDAPPDPHAQGASELFHDTRLYAGLVGVAPVRQVARLAGLLYWDRSESTDARPLTLEQCLDRARSPSVGSRAATSVQSVLGLYWNAREQAARHQLLRELVAQLDSVAALAAAESERAERASDVLVWRAARLSAAADLLRSETDLVTSQWHLMAAFGERLDAAWIWPATAPHAGRYRPRPGGDASRAPGAASSIQSGAGLAELHHLLVQQTAAVIARDAARSAAIRDYAAGQVSMPRLLRSLAGETDETLTLLHTLTQYNVSIADYALAILPANAPTPTLVRMLVVEPTATSSKG